MSAVWSLLKSTPSRVEKLRLSFATVNPRSDAQSKNALESMLATLLEMLTLVIMLQLLNAEIPMLVTPLSITTDVIFLAYSCQGAKVSG